uniref:Pentatricopeptide repeat-containing protein-mitochondrial domain-containing protein n=1 Tax=Cucumis sativus TaxID=3659 RepID=A0A0A0KFM9_CUCSA
MAYSAVLPLAFTSSSKVCKPTSSSSSIEQHIEIYTNTSQKFRYSRASPSVRWPNLKLNESFQLPSQTHFTAPPPPPPPPSQTHMVDESEVSLRTQTSEIRDGSYVEEDESESSRMVSDETQEVLGRPSKTRVKKMNKLALKRAKDWRERVQFLTDRILALKHDQFVADVLDDRKVQMTPTDFCFVVKWVGRSNWQRALEVYEWLNLRHWYSPNARMLATILAVLGKANQEKLAVEIFKRSESAIDNTVQVYNAMMGVYARNGRFVLVQKLLDLMRKRGCEPDLVSFNTLINARMKSGPMTPNLSLQFLNEVRKSGVRPDIITYNTLISACSRESNLEEAMKVYNDMERHNCQPDLWTYNAMISVYGRCGLASRAEQLFMELESKGFFPDAVTYNSLLFAFAKEGNVEKVKEICEEMVRNGFGKDEMTYNTIIHMYGKQEQHDLAFQLYRDMKLSGRIPDEVTYTILIDSLGKSSKIEEAANIMTEMLDSGVKPTLRTYSALICGYGKVGKPVEAEKTFDCMRRSGIRPDYLAYSVMIDLFLRFNETKKAMLLYKEMVCDGLTPDGALYEVMLRNLVKENKLDDIDKVIRDMRDEYGMNPQVISSILIKGECYGHAATMLRVTIDTGYDLDNENLLSILSAYSLSGRYLEACELLEFLKEKTSNSNQLVTESLIVVLCKTKQIDAALVEYGNMKKVFGSYGTSSLMYECLIHGCQEKELFDTASHIFSDMMFYVVKISDNLYQVMIRMYCKRGYPEIAHYLLERAELEGVVVDDVSTYVEIIDSFGELKLWQKAESLVGNKRLKLAAVDRKIWNALIQAYAKSGCYERARAVFNTMMRDGPSPTVISINGLLQALIADNRLKELYVVVQELQDMGFKISKSSVLLMLDAFARDGNIFEVKKIYHGMIAAGYLPTMHLYRSMIELLCKGKRVRDVEAMLSEMEETGFRPDLSILNSVIKLYVGVEDFRNASRVYHLILETGLTPDEDTYNSLIIMYCRDCRPEEGLSLMHEMKRRGMEPVLDTYKSLISALSKRQLVEEAEELFEELRGSGYKLDRFFYHVMMKMFRNTGNHLKAESLLVMMKESGIDPTVATMHLLMVSYGSSGHPKEAEKVLNDLKATGMDLDTLPYSSVIDAYLRNKDYSAGIQKLMAMKADGIEPDYRIWTCCIRAASLSESSSEAIIILNALQDTGFDLPIRLLTQKSGTLILEVDQFLEKLGALEDDDAGFNFVNALEDLLWAFELRATASWVFQLAIKRSIYRQDIFRWTKSTIVTIKLKSEFSLLNQID